MEPPNIKLLTLQTRLLALNEAYFQLLLAVLLFITNFMILYSTSFDNEIPIKKTQIYMKINILLQGQVKIKQIILS